MDTDFIFLLKISVNVMKLIFNVYFEMITKGYLYLAQVLHSQLVKSNRI